MGKIPPINPFPPQLDTAQLDNDHIYVAHRPEVMKISKFFSQKIVSQDFIALEYTKWRRYYKEIIQKQKNVKYQICLFNLTFFNKILYLILNFSKSTIHQINGIITIYLIINLIIIQMISLILYLIQLIIIQVLNWVIMLNLCSPIFHTVFCKRNLWTLLKNLVYKVSNKFTNFIL